MPLLLVGVKMKHLVLVGFMGTGKTAIGKQVARRLSLPFIDTDQKIEEQAGKTIPQIFAEEGETGFRNRESATIRSVVEGPTAVIATGGGTLLRSENLENLRKRGILICLTAHPEVILERVKHNPNRPLLANSDNLLQRITELLETRRPVYAQADFTIDTSHRDMDEIAQEVIQIWQQHQED